MARNVIKRAFGTLKRRFSLMVASPEYSEEKQAKFILALCVLHNFVSVYDGNATERHFQQPSGTGVSHQFTHLEPPRPGWVSEVEELSASVRRDETTAKMWAEYQKYLAGNVG
jgi:hypothetical protein